jgi:hypothetical protein
MQRLAASGTDPRLVQRRLKVGTVQIQQNNLKEELDKDPGHRGAKTPGHVAYKYQDWANDGTTRDHATWNDARREADQEIELDRVVYLALARLATTPMGSWVGAKARGTASVNTKRVLNAIVGVQQRYKRACKGAVNNVFNFGNVDFFVDHDANYIFPKAEVDVRGTLPGQPTWAADRDLGKKFSYPDNKLPRYEAVDIITALAKGNENDLDVDASKLCIFLASFVAEPERNAVAQVTNLMVYAGSLGADSKLTAESNVFDVMPMTKGGTAKPGEKLGPFDKAMAEFRSQGTGLQVPPKASSEEIRLVLGALAPAVLLRVRGQIAAGQGPQAVLTVHKALRSSITKGAGAFGDV